MSRGLLLGAGFSYDLGMPLVQGLTKDFFYFLTKERIKSFVELWKMTDPYGEGRPIDKNAIEEIIGIIEEFRNNGSNYEDFLKELQRRTKILGSKQSYIDSYHYLYGKFYSIIAYLFFMYHTNNYAYYEINKKVYSNFSKFVGDRELWVLTLNHDMFIEFLCMDQSIPISFGADDILEFPISNHDLDNTITFKALNRAKMGIENMGFFKGKRGVNILKLHGALNEFSYNDDKVVIHMEIQDKDTPLTYIKKLNTVIHDMKYMYQGSRVEIGGSEIAVSDLKGELQFLRQSILMGGYKYSKTFDPKPGEEKLRVFEDSLRMIDELTIVGYSFCDEHINLRLYNAMLLNPNMKVMIVDPFRKKTPDILKPFDYKLRVRMTKSFIPEWLWYTTTGNWNLEHSEELNAMRTSRESMEVRFRTIKLK